MDKYTGTMLTKFKPSMDFKDDPAKGLSLMSEETDKALLDLLGKSNELAGETSALSSKVDGVDTLAKQTAALVAIPLLYARYTGVAAIAPNTPFNFATKDKDSYNAVTPGAAWKFTAPKTGVYAVVGMVWPTGGVDLYMYKGGVSSRYVRNIIANRVQFSDQVYLAAGEYIDYRCATALTADALSYINISYLGSF